MGEPVFVADLSAVDYPRFQEKDPTLPGSYDKWAVAAAERALRLRRSGVNLISYPILFDAFVERNEILHIASFDEASRDNYADEQGRTRAALANLYGLPDAPIPSPRNE